MHMWDKGRVLPPLMGESAWQRPPLTKLPSDPLPPPPPPTAIPPTHPGHQASILPPSLDC